MKRGARIVLGRGVCAIVERTYVEHGRVVSLTATVKGVLTFRGEPIELIVYPRDEGVTWARGWKTKAANAFRTAAALS